MPAHCASSALRATRLLRSTLTCLITLCVAQQGVTELGVAQPPQAQPPQAQREAPDRDPTMATLSLLRHDASALSQGEVSSAQLSVSSGAQGVYMSLWGAWGRVTLSNQSWTTVHNELRLHPQVNLATRVGRASLALTSGAGVATVYERRSRHQAERLGLSGVSADTSALRWGLELSAGASISLPLSERVGLQLSSLALLRPWAFSAEARSLTYAQSLGLSWSFQ